MVLPETEGYFRELGGFTLYLDRYLLQLISHFLSFELPGAGLCQLCIDFPHCFTRLFNWWLDVCDARIEKKYGNQLCYLTIWWHNNIDYWTAVSRELDFPCLVVVCSIRSICKFLDSICSAHFLIPNSLLFNILWFPKLLL